jgi:hypothetical protein
VKIQKYGDGKEEQSGVRLEFAFNISHPRIPYTLCFFFFIIYGAYAQNLPTQSSVSLCSSILHRFLFSDRWVISGHLWMRKN